MAIFYYRQSPIPVPPSQGSLRFWLDAQDLSVPDGTIVTSINNKGTLGGSFIERNPSNGWPSTGQATAGTVDGKRVLSYEPNKTQSLISTQNILLQAENTILTVTRNQANMIPGGIGGPYGNAGHQFSIGDVIWLKNEEQWYNYPYSYFNSWKTITNSSINTTIDAGDISAIVLQFDRSLIKPSIFSKIKKDSVDYSTTIVPYSLSNGSYPMVVGGLLSSGGGGGEINSYAGKIHEMMVWEGIVDTGSIKTYLNQKYGGTW